MLMESRVTMMGPDHGAKDKIHIWLPAWPSASCYSIRVPITELLAAIDVEIRRLQHVRELLTGSVDVKRRRGGHENGFMAGEIARSPVVKRKLSPAGRKKIADAQRRRWAKQKQVPVTKLPPKQAPVRRARKAASATSPTALTGGVPQGPVSAPAPKKDLLEHFS